MTASVPSLRVEVARIQAKYLQIRVASGEKLELQDTRAWSFRGRSIECRINTEDPRTFAPWPGLITEYSSRRPRAEPRLSGARRSRP